MGFIIVETVALPIAAPSWTIGDVGSSSLLLFSDFLVLSVKLCNYWIEENMDDRRLFKCIPPADVLTTSLRLVYPCRFATLLGRHLSFLVIMTRVRRFLMADGRGPVGLFIFWTCRLITKPKSGPDYIMIACSLPVMYQTSSFEAGIMLIELILPCSSTEVLERGEDVENSLWSRPV